MKNLIHMSPEHQDNIIRELVIRLSDSDSKLLAINKAFQAGMLARDFYLSPHQLTDYSAFLENLAIKTHTPDDEVQQLLYSIRDQYIDRLREASLSQWFDSLAVWLYETHTPDLANGPAVVQMVNTARKWRENRPDMESTARQILNWFSIDAKSLIPQIKDILTIWADGYQGDGDFTPPDELLDILKRDV